jgi:hypothetical protein
VKLVLSSLHSGEVYSSHIKHEKMKSVIILFLLTLSFAAQSQTQEICPGDIPPGWVIISYRPCAGCCGGPPIVQKPTIQRIDNLSAGEMVEMCPQQVPAGWVIVAYRQCAGCCTGCCAGSGFIYRPIIKRVDGLPSGTVLEICPQDIPWGWVVVSTRSCANCCDGKSFVNKPTIKKL